MIDIVKALREQADSDEKAGTLYSHVVARRAADEIETLRLQVLFEQTRNEALLKKMTDILVLLPNDHPVFKINIKEGEL